MPGAAQTLALTCAPRGCHCPEEEVPEFPHIAAAAGCRLPYESRRNDGFLPPSRVESIPYAISAPHRLRFGVFSQGYRRLAARNTCLGTILGSKQGDGGAYLLAALLLTSSPSPTYLLGGCHRLNNRSVNVPEGLLHSPSRPPEAGGWWTLMLGPAPLVPILRRSTSKYDYPWVILVASGTRAHMCGPVYLQIVASIFLQENPSSQHR